MFYRYGLDHKRLRLWSSNQGSLTVLILSYPEISINDNSEYRLKNIEMMLILIIRHFLFFNKVNIFFQDKLDKAILVDFEYPDFLKKWKTGLILQVTSHYPLPLLLQRASTTDFFEADPGEFLNQTGPILISF